MAYVVPTPPDVRAVYPEFTGVADAVIQGALDKAALKVDDGWTEASFKIAQMLYAAHVLTLGGFGSSVAASGGGGGVGSIKMERAGDTAFEYVTAGPGSSVAGSAAWYGRTSYGAEFYQMQREQFGGPRVY